MALISCFVYMELYLVDSGQDAFSTFACGLHLCRETPALVGNRANLTVTISRVCDIYTEKNYITVV